MVNGLQYLSWRALPTALAADERVVVWAVNSSLVRYPGAYLPNFVVVVVVVVVRWSDRCLVLGAWCAPSILGEQKKKRAAGRVQSQSLSAVGGEGGHLGREKGAANQSPQVPPTQILATPRSPAFPSLFSFYSPPSFRPNPSISCPSRTHIKCPKPPEPDRQLPAPALTITMARPPKAKAAESSKAAIAPPKVIDVENFVRVRDSVSILSCPAFLSLPQMI